MCVSMFLEGSLILDKINFIFLHYCNENFLMELNSCYCHAEREVSSVRFEGVMFIHFKTFLFYRKKLQSMTEYVKKHILDLRIIKSFISSTGWIHLGLVRSELSLILVLPKCAFILSPKSRI